VEVQRAGRRFASLAGVLATAMLLGPVDIGEAKQKVTKVKATPGNLTYGALPRDAPAIATVKSGEVALVDTIGAVGGTSTVSPEVYFGQFGVKPGDVLQDVKDFWASLPGRVRSGPHPLTGPIYVEGAVPGNVLQVDVLDLQTRVPYGVNFTAPFSGVLAPTYPGFRPGDLGLNIPEPPADAIAGLYPDVRQHLIRTGRNGKGEEVAFFSKEVQVPLRKHLGVMGVAPADGMWVGSSPGATPPADLMQGSGPPGPFGGNMDISHLGPGWTLYLPVFQEGAQFFTGDGHGAEGDGEVSGTAIEQSLTGKLRFTVRKDMKIDLPRLESAESWVVMGIDHDLDRAMRIAVLEAVEFLVAEKGMTEAKAYSLASVAVDFHSAEVVDGTQVVIGTIKKSLFLK
jgi:acetamidase/formamidase